LGLIGIIETTRRIPSSAWHAALTRTAAKLSYNISHYKRHAIETHLARAFPSLSDAERERMTRNAFYAFWEEWFFWAYSDLNQSKSRVQVSGMEHLARALERGHGAILWESNGFGKRLLSKQLLRERGVNMIQVHALGHLGGIGANG